MDQDHEQGGTHREAPKRAWAALNGAPLGDPTQETYAELVEAYRHFNEALFDGRYSRAAPPAPAPTSSAIATACQ